jgi:hypothetical protein
MIIEYLKGRYGISVRTLRTVFPAVPAALCAFLAVWGGTGSRLYQRPDLNRFLETYFKEPFLAFLVILTLWFISALRIRPDRKDEYRMLDALPLSPRKIGLHFVLQNGFDDFWVPWISLLLVASLYEIAPVSYLCRVGLMTVLGYALSTGFHAVWQCRAAVRAGSIRTTFPNRNHPMITGISILFFALFHWTFLMNPVLVSGAAFWIAVAAAGMCIAAIPVLARRAFTKWLQANGIHRSAGRDGSFSGAFLLRFPGRLPGIPPLLLKNFIRGARMTHPVSYLMTAAFVLALARVSMNNQSLADRMSVMVGVIAVFSCLFSYGVMTRLSEGNEPAQLLYSLPMRKRTLYLSEFLPAFSGLALINAVLSAVLFVSSRDAGSSAALWLKSTAVSAVFLLLAVNTAVADYPDVKKARRKYMIRLFAMVMASAVFYRFHEAAVLLILILSFLPLRRLCLYRTSAKHGR